MTADDIGIGISFFSDARDNFPKHTTLTWGRFFAVFDEHSVVEEKLSCPMMAPVVFDGNRSKKNAQSCYLAVADFDDISDNDLEGVRKRCGDFDLSYILYTTHSHAKARASGLNRVRLIVPLSRPVSKNEWNLFWPRWKQFFDVDLDKSCSDISHGFFGPYVPSEADLALAWTEKKRGNALDVDVFLSIPIENEILAEAEPGTQEIDRGILKTVSARLLRRKSESDQQIAIQLQQVLRGEIFAQPGSIDTTLYNISKCLSRELPYASPRSIAEHFGTSLQLMAQTWPDYAMTVEQAAEKISRCQVKHKERQLAEEQQRIVAEKTRIKQAFRSVQIDRDKPYTHQELEHFATLENCTQDEMQKRWLIRAGSALYFYVAGQYLGPATCKSDALNWCEIMLAPAASLGVAIHQTDKNGKLFFKSVDQLVSDYGQIAKSIIIDTAATRAYFDAQAAEIVEAPFKIRVKAQYSEEVNTFFKLLGGSKSQELFSWLARFPDLAQPSVLLFLFGAGGGGKSLTAMGLSRVFSLLGPTSLNDAMGSFNDAILNNPLLLGDEDLPRDHKGRIKTEDLREQVQSRQRSLRRKFMPVAKIRGAFRFMVAANDDNLFMQAGDPSANDIDAFASRILMINIGDAESCAAKEYLLRTPHTHWIDDDIMAKHIVWLYENHKWEPKGRFGIVDPENRMKEALTTRTGTRFTITLFLVRYLMNTKPVDISPAKEFVRFNGRLYAQARGFQRYWEQYMPAEPCPKAYQVSRSLSGISKKRVKLLIKGKRTWYREIDLAILRSFAEEHDEATEEDIIEALKENTNEVSV
jgi:hypothetical protein